jgi:hypothetical protein
MTSEGLSLSLDSRLLGVSSTRKRRNASGDKSLDFVPSERVEVRDRPEVELDRLVVGRSMCSSKTSVAEDFLPRSPSTAELRRLKRRLHAGAGEDDLCNDESLRTCEGAVEIRVVAASAGTGGARRGVMYFASGLIVLKSVCRTELNEALRWRNDLSIGILNVLTVCPGR